MKDEKKKSLWQQMGRKTPDMVSNETMIVKKKKKQKESPKEPSIWDKTGRKSAW